MKDNQQLEFNFEAVVEAVAQAQTEEEVVTILEGLSMKDLRTFSAKTYSHKARSKKELAVSLARVVWDDAIYIRAGRQDAISQSNPVNAARIALTAARTPAQEAEEQEEVAVIAEARSEQEVKEILCSWKPEKVVDLAARNYRGIMEMRKNMYMLIDMLAYVIWLGLTFVDKGGQPKRGSFRGDIHYSAFSLARYERLHPQHQQAVRFEAGRAYKGYTRSGRFRVFEVVRRTPCFIWVRGEMCLGTERHRVYEEDGTEKAIHDMLLYKYTIDSAAEFDPFTDRMPEPAGGSTIITNGYTEPEDIEDEDTDTFAADEPEPVIEAEAPAIREDETWILGSSPDGTLTLRNAATGETKCLTDTHAPEGRTPDTNKQTVPTGCKANNTIRIPVCRTGRAVCRTGRTVRRQADRQSLRVPSTYKPDVVVQFLQG